MKIIDCVQGSEEWLKARAGVVTASECDSIFKQDFTLRTGETPHTYMCTKLAERLLGGPLPSFNSFGVLEQGSIREEQARPWYELEYDTTIEQVGFITTDDGKVGCSPDGMFTPLGGIEIKCPLAQTHVKYLLAQEVPLEYLPQIHASMYVTGAPWWKFLSYRPGLPPLVLTVERNEEIQSKIHDGLTIFNAKLDTAFKRLKEK